MTADDAGHGRRGPWRGLLILAVALVSVTFPRIGFLKATEAFALIAAPGALGSRRLQAVLIRCYWPFVAATMLSFSTAYGLLAFGVGDPSLTSEKGLYSDPALIPMVTLLRLAVYLLGVAGLAGFFMTAGTVQVRRALTAAYYVAVAPGLLQIFRIYSGIQFDLPFERPGFGPFSGVFDAGPYIRLMGFEYEPLGYATSLVVVCCCMAHCRRGVPWIGLAVLGHTFGAGAIGGALLALIIARRKRLVRWLVPLYGAAAALVFAYVFRHYDALVDEYLPLGSLVERLGAIRACVSMFLDHPLGVGLGLYGLHFNLYNQIPIYDAASLDYYPNNDLAMFLAYGGIIYALAYLYTFHFVIRRCRSYWVRVAAVALLIQSFTSYLFFNPAIILVFSLALAGARQPAALAATSVGKRPVIRWRPLFPIPIDLLPRRRRVKR